jgi:hypothetical protein
LTKFDVLKLLG